MTEDKLIGLRDPHGFRPLVLGKLDGGYVLASESCALDSIGAKLIREVKPGEMVVIDKNGIKAINALPSIKSSLCIFEFVYFARPDSCINGKNVHAVRKKFGMTLGEEHPVKADMVIAVPDSGLSAAVGLAAGTGILYGEGLMKNRYIWRTFIQPDQNTRDLGVKVKLNPIKEAVNGKKIILVDDSIVRGTTSGKIIKMLKDAGAKEVHMRISSPPYKYPCFYGIDTPTREELIASSNTVEEIAKKFGADSLGYLSLEGMVKATGIPKEDFCLACFTGDYPIKIPAQSRISKYILERESYS